MLFDSEVIPLIRRILRLRNELGVNYAGVGVILELMSRIEALEARIRELENALVSITGFEDREAVILSEDFFSMDINKFTTKSQEALQAAETKAIRFGHIEVDGEHLLLAMLEQPDGLAPRLFQKMDIPVDRMRERLEQELNRKPRVSGPGVEPRQNIYNQPLEQAAYRCAGAGPETQG